MAAAAPAVARVAPALVAPGASAPRAGATALAGYSTDDDAAAFFAANPSFAGCAWLDLLPDAEHADAARFPQALPAAVTLAHVVVAVPQTLTLATAQGIADAADALLGAGAGTGAGAAARPLVISCATTRRAGAALTLLHARANAWGPEEALAFAQAHNLSFASVQVR